MCLSTSSWGSGREERCFSRSAWEDSRTGEIGRSSMLELEVVIFEMCDVNVSCVCVSGLFSYILVVMFLCRLKRGFVLCLL